MIDVERTGDWMPAEELNAAVLAATEGNSDLTLKIDPIDHLDESAMQILLPLRVEQMRRGQQLHLVNASPQLLRWFQLSGAADHLSLNQQDSQ